MSNYRWLAAAVVVAGFAAVSSAQAQDYPSKLVR
ncbi:MAG: hypothetical protein JWQ07_5184, partial [Ramlibacter sp.]|nr:hypothetical protein [Ramlibacter sp.]